MTGTEKGLFQKARSGDIEAFDQLAGGYYKKIYNIAYTATGNREDACVLAQKVFIDVYRSLSSIDEASFTAHVFKTTGEYCMKEVKRQKAYGMAIIGRMV
jgi:RNA polymerase sigma-70 factor (ECF subfamily)